MCRIAVDSPAELRVLPTAARGRVFLVVLLAMALGGALGLAESVGTVWWPPVAMLVAGCAALGVTAPRAAWGLGLAAGAAAAAADFLFGHGRITALHFGVFGGLG